MNLKSYLCITALALFTVSGAQNIPNYVPASGLVAWWPFNGNANDESGNLIHGTVNGPVLTTDRFGNAGKAYSFDGIDDMIEVPEKPALICRKITVSLWVYSLDSSPAEILYKADLNTAASEMYSLTSVYDFAVKSGSGCAPGVGWQNVQYKQNGNILVWNQVVATYDGDSILIYHNGVRRNGTYLKSLIDSCAGSNVRFGYAHNYLPNCGYPFKGKLDDIGIWNRALTAQEIAKLYQSGVGLSAGDPANRLRVYPNPAGNELYVNGISNTAETEYTILDMSGRKMIQGMLSAGSSRINTGELSSGVYMLQLNDTVPLKFVINR